MTEDYNRRRTRERPKIPLWKMNKSQKKVKERRKKVKYITEKKNRLKKR